MDKLVEIGFLYEFYGELLTKRQSAIIEAFYFQDFSLNEIAENLNISKQAVYDTMQRAEKNLYEMEEVLHLLQNYREKEYCVDEIRKLLIPLKNDQNTVIIERINTLLSSL